MEVVLPLFLFGLGATLASFMLVVAERMHTGESWRAGRSRCNSCAHELGPLDLIPVLSWLLSGGKCRRCGSRVPAAYLVAEALLGSLFVVAYLVTGLSIALPVLLACLALLLALVAYDLRHMMLPSGLSWPLILLSLLYAYLVAPTSYELGVVLLTSGLVAAFFFAFHVASGGRAMGLGDAPLGAALALIAGPLAFSGVIYSFWIGGVIGIFVLLARAPGTRIGIEVPFAPFLAAGFLLALFTSWDILYIIGIS